MSRVAAHAVQPVCPRCGRPVRGSLEVSAELSVLAGLVAQSAALATRGGEDDERLHAAVLFNVQQELEALQSELGGQHQDPARCRSRGDASILWALASEVARRER